MTRKPIDKDHFISYPIAEEHYDLNDHVEYVKGKDSLIIRARILHATCG